MRNRKFLVSVLAWSGRSSRVAAALRCSCPGAAVPGHGSEPMVMFAMSVDHQLFKKAFDDYSDLKRRR